MNKTCKLVGSLGLAAAVLGGCARKAPPAPAAARGPGAAPAAQVALAAWEPVDKQFTGCAGS